MSSPAVPRRPKAAPLRTTLAAVEIQDPPAPPRPPAPAPRGSLAKLGQTLVPHWPKVKVNKKGARPS